MIDNPIIITKRNTDSDGNPVSVYLIETKQIFSNGSFIVLKQVPDELHRVSVQGYKEVYDVEKMKVHEFKVDYNQGVVYFHPKAIGKTVVVEYYGIGYELISASRIFTKYDNRGNVIETLEDVVEKVHEVKPILDRLTKSEETINQIHTDLDKAEVVMPQLQDSTTKGEQIKNELDTSIQNAQEDILKIKATGNKEVLVSASEWVLNQGIYEKQIVHGLNSENIHVTVKNSDTKESCTIGWKIINKTTILLKSDEAINMSVVVSASYYKPLIEGDVSQDELIRARRGESSLDVKVQKIDNNISKLSEDLELKANESDLIIERNRIDNILALPEDSSINNARLEDICIGSNGENYSTPGNAVREQINNINKLLGYSSLSIEKIIDVELTVTTGINIGLNGVNYENQYVSYGTADVVGGSEVIVNGYSQGSTNYPFIIFKKDNSIVSNVYISSGTHKNYRVTVPSEANKIIINGNYTKYIESETLIYPTLKKVVILPSKTLKEYIDGTKIMLSPLYSKKVSFNGDSIMFGQGYLGGFAKMIADKYSMVYENVAVSGGIISYTTNESVHCISKAVENMAIDSDYIILEGGYNDYIYKTPLGVITNGMNDTINNKTILGGAEQMCRNLLARFPGKKIGFILTHKINNTDYTPITDWNGVNSRTMRDVHDGILNVLKKYSIHVCDLYNISCFNTELEEYKKYTADLDGIHLNKEGYELFYLDKVENFMLNL